jgi:hypothetical protein
MNETRNIKDSLFVALFNNEAAARELHNAINGTNYGPETPVVITTLDDVLYKGIKNDVSFTIGDTYMALFEQQSSFNPNIPLRILLYTARVYERQIPNKEFHKNTLLMISRPQPVMLYICTDSSKSAMKTNRKILRLSDAFKGVPSGLGSLELEVLVINISPGYNKRILQRSPLLRGYVTFITRFRENEKTMSRARAVLEAVDWCIGQDILADFLRAHRKEVSNMILNELTNEDAIEAAREETWEKASKEVREETWDEASQATSEANLKQVLELIDKGLTREQLKQALQRDRLRVVPQATRTKSSKR